MDSGNILDDELIFGAKKLKFRDSKALKSLIYMCIGVILMVFVLYFSELFEQVINSYRVERGMRIVFVFSCFIITMLGATESILSILKKEPFGLKYLTLLGNLTPVAIVFSS